MSNTVVENSPPIRWSCFDAVGSLMIDLTSAAQSALGHQEEASFSESYETKEPTITNSYQNNICATVYSCTVDKARVYNWK